MADTHAPAINNAIALQVQTPNAMNTMKDMVGIGTGLQTMKSNQITLGERQALQGVLSDLKKYDQGGQPDYNRLVTDVMAVAPTTGAEYLTKIIQTHQASNEAQKSFLSLNQEQRAAAGQLFASLGNYSPEDAKKISDAYMQANPNVAPMVDFAWKYQLGPAANNPETWKNATLNVAQGTMKVPEQVQAIQPKYHETGGVQVQTNPVAAAAGAPPGLINTLPPTTPAVNPQTGQPGYVGSQAGGGHVVSGLAPGQVQNIADLQKEVTAVRSAGDQVPTQRNINQSILRLSRDTQTGPGTQYWQKGLASMGLGFGDNYQELGKFLEKNAIQNMQAMGGPPSDARLSAAVAANGSTEFVPGALQAVTKFNDATNSAVDKYRQGMDKSVGLENPNFGNAARFKADWAKNLDIDVFRVENAIRDGDTMELKKISHELGPEKMKQLAKKRKNLEALSTSGKLP